MCTAEERLAPVDRLPFAVEPLLPAGRPAVVAPEVVPLLLPLNRCHPPDWAAVPVDAVVPRFGVETRLVDVDGFTCCHPPVLLLAAVCAAGLVLAAAGRLAAMLLAERAMAWRC